MRMLLVTNDFPPRAGGIQQYCHNLVLRLPPDEVLVYAPAWPGASQFDAAQPFRVVRHPTGRMLPGRAVEQRAADLVREFRPQVVVFGATFPLGLSAGRITRATGVPCVGWTSGVDADAYHPEVDGRAVRERHGLGDAPVCVCVSRLVARKGQDVLIRAWPSVVAQVPDARLLLVGGGSYERRLRRLAPASPAADRITLTRE